LVGKRRKSSHSQPTVTKRAISEHLRGEGERNVRGKKLGGGKWKQVRILTLFKNNAKTFQLTKRTERGAQFYAKFKLKSEKGKGVPSATEDTVKTSGRGVVTMRISFYGRKGIEILVRNQMCELKKRGDFN